MKYALWMGQSNAMFRGTGSQFDVSPRIQLWNNENERNDLVNIGDAFVAPNRNSWPFTDGYDNNFGYQCFRTLSERIGDDIRVVILGKGGHPISGWDRATGGMYARLMAIVAAAGITGFDFFGWHQGESAEPNPSGYASSFNQLLSDMETDGLITSSTPVVIGTLAPKFVLMNPILKGLAGGRVGIARISHLPMKSDGTHFAGPSALPAGAAYAGEFCRLMNTEYVAPDFVSATGITGVTFNSAAETKIPIEPFAGNVDWIQDGCFVCQKPGVYRFSATAFTAAGKMQVKLLDDTGIELSRVAFTGSADAAGNNMIASGFCDISCGYGDKIWLGARQTSGSTSEITDVISAKYNYLSAQLLVAF